MANIKVFWASEKGKEEITNVDSSAFLKNDSMHLIPSAGFLQFVKELSDFFSKKVYENEKAERDSDDVYLDYLAIKKQLVFPEDEGCQPSVEFNLRLAKDEVEVEFLLIEIGNFINQYLEDVHWAYFGNGTYGSLEGYAKIEFEIQT